MSLHQLNAPERIETLLRLEHEMGVMRRRIKRVVAGRAREIHPDLGGASYWMLISIAENGPLRAAALVEEFHLDKGAVSRQLHHLFDLGLVVREPDPADGRASLLSLSEEGAERMQKAVDARRARAAQQLKDWSDEELNTLVELMGRYNRSFEALVGDPGATSR